MPYKSIAQERFFHTATAKADGIKPSTVSEFDQASKGRSLPQTAAPTPYKVQPEPKFQASPLNASAWTKMKKKVPDQAY